MGAVRHASAAVDADKRLSGSVEIDSIHRTGLCAGPTADAELLSHHDASALPLGIRACRAGRNAGRGVAGQAEPWLEPCREAAGGPDADSSRVPGQTLMHKPRTGERTRMASDAALHSRRGQNFHGLSLFLRFLTLKVVRKMKAERRKRRKRACLRHLRARCHGQPNGRNNSQCVISEQTASYIFPVVITNLLLRFLLAFM